MKKLLIAAIGVAMFSSAALAAPKTSSVRERVKFVRMARNLELKPLAFDAVKQRQWATEFVVSKPDLHLELCDGVLTAPLQDTDQNYSSQLSMQFMLSSAAFMLRHPKVTDPVRIQLAGVEGTLRAYQSILKVDKTAHFDFLDQLAQEDKRGQLATYVASATHTCGDLTEKAPQRKWKLVP